MEKLILLNRSQKARLLRDQLGFTLIELLVTISILAILLAIAVPNFITFIQNNRVTSQTNDLVTALNYARSEAIKRGVRTTVCSRATDTSCAASTTWDTGWLVFVDCNGDGVRDLGTCPDWDAIGGADDEPVLLVRQPLQNGNTLRTGGIQRVTYQSSGFSGFMGTLRLCDVRGTANARATVVSFQGRVRTNTLVGEGLTCP